MPENIQLITQFNGLNLQFDPLDTPEGSFERLQNFWTQREGLIETRRGFDRYGTVAANQIVRMFEYRDRLIRNLDDGTLQFDSDGAGAWTSYTGTFLPPDTEVRMRNLEVRQTNFITTSGGVFRQDELTADPERAGLAESLDMSLTLTGTGAAGHFNANSQIAYNYIFIRVDANDRTLRSAPLPVGERLTNALLSSTWTSAATTVTVTTPSAHGFTTGDSITMSGGSDAAVDGTFTITVTGGTTFTYVVPIAPTGSPGTVNVGKTFDVDIVATLADDTVAGDFVEIYRTLDSANATTIPSAEFFKVRRIEVSAGDVTAGTLSFSDDVLDDFLGERLYTNPTQQTAAAANHRPPRAVDLVEYQGHVFYFNTQREQEVDLQFIDVAGLVAGTDTITIGAETYTFEVAENIGAREFLLETTLSTLAENVEATMKSLVRVINRGTNVIDAFYISSFTDAPGKILVRSRTLGTAVFSVTANVVATGDNFEPELPTSGTAVSSSAPGAVNEVAISKFEQPDSVPRLSTQMLGGQDDEIKRAFTLRDSVVVFKLLDGVFVISGETDGLLGRTFAFRLHDPSVRIDGAATGVLLNNVAMVNTTLGFVAASDQGVELIGRNIENETKRIAEFTNFRALAHSVPYVSENLFVCFLPNSNTDTEPTTSFGYNTLNRQWSSPYVKPISAAHVLSANDLLYTAQAVDDFTLEERKARTEDNADYQDEVIAVTVNTVGTTVVQGITRSFLNITYTYTEATLQQGFLFTQGTTFAPIITVVDTGGSTFDITLQSEIPGLITGAATVTLPIFSELKTVPITGGRSAILLKKYQEVAFDFESDRAFSHFVGFVSDLVPVEEFNTVPYSSLPENFGWGLSAWGTSPWGDAGPLSATPIIVQTPASYFRARRLQYLYKHQVAKEKVSLAQISVIFRFISKRSNVKVPRVTA